MSQNWFENAAEKVALGSLEERMAWQREYAKIVDEVLEQTRNSDVHAPGQRQGLIGKRLPRNDVLYKVRGKAKYAHNVVLDGMLHACHVRSIEPHARIVNIDVEDARQSPGVVAILTANDIDPDRLLIGTHFNDTPVLAKGRVRYVGEPIVAIAAETLEAAEAACRLVHVEYEPLIPILSADDALAPGATLVDPEGNIKTEHLHCVGDVEAGLAQAHIVLDGTFTTEPIDHCFMESQAGLAFVDTDGVLTLLVSTQYPHFHHKQIARVTGLPFDKIRVIQTVVGGAFGGKIDDTVECVSCLLALKTGRPVKMVLTREEVFTSTTKRHRLKFRQRLGVTLDGQFTALDLDVIADGGAYRSYGRVVAGRCVIHGGMPYRFPNLRVHFLTAFTNHVPSGSMRSFGVVKMAFALESQINELARRLKISPIDIRRINGLRDGDRISTGQIVQDVGLGLTLDAIEPIYKKRAREIVREPTPERKRGLGIACLGYGIGYSGTRNPSTARIRISPEGQIIAFSGTPDIGTGSDMVLAQITAEALRVNVGRVSVVSGDSTLTDDSGPTSASRTTYFSGNAICIAATDFKRQFGERLAEKLGGSAGEIRFEDDGVVVGNRRVGMLEACRILGPITKEICGYGKFDPDIEIDILSFRGNPYPTYTYATHLVEIEVDEALGSVEVLNCWAAHDAGEVINPIGAEGQIEGGVVQGIGMALWERVSRQDGRIVNAHYRDYLLPGAKDVPTAISSYFVKARDRTGPYGAKGVAETSIIPLPGAIASALADAVGIQPRQLPMSPEYVYRLISEKQPCAERPPKEKKQSSRRSRDG